VCGTATTISFENRFAWVGMVLVDRNTAAEASETELLKRAIEYLDGLKIPAIKLDATPQGKPLYYESWNSCANMRLNDGLCVGLPPKRRKCPVSARARRYLRNSWNPSARRIKRFLAQTGVSCLSPSTRMRLSSPPGLETME